ncbi:MAG TPA: FlgD immunoglobulin-like domain containing protein, partial [bacterium]|nr:FlgD immunoglobulin-like domain containing protein [bacterium]
RTPTPIPLLLSPHFPNPDPAGAGGLWLPYTLSIPAKVTFHVFDIAGELVRHLDAGVQGAGNHEQHWDLYNDNGHPVASGVYLCRVTAQAKGQERMVWEKCSVLR